jgi:uncharacterized membrane protein
MQSIHWIVWNILLAVIPVVAAYLLAAGATEYSLRPNGVTWLAWLPLALVWFAFLPNTCYLLTEWRHFLFDPYFTTWRMNADNNATTRLIVARQGLFFLVYSGVGVFCYTLAIRPIERLLRRTRVNPLLLAPPFFFFTSLGVYMGLIRRLNSWDIVNRPRLVWDLALHALTTPILLQVISVFAVLLWLLYEIVDIFVDGVAQRLGRFAPPPVAMGGKSTGNKRKAKA